MITVDLEAPFEIRVRVELGARNNSCPSLFLRDQD
jgi:hypothetical protein